MSVAAREFARPRGLSRLVWLSVTCLDAPLVAISWQWLFARSFHARITVAARIVLFLSAWLIYLGDRLTDSFTIPRQSPASARQHFCLAHRNVMMLGFVFIAMTAGLLALRTLDHQTLCSGAVVGAAIGIYLVVNHLASPVWKTIPLKELSIGTLFALGTVSAIHVRGFAFASATLLFAILCSSNCLSISMWEQMLDRAQNRVTFATAFPRSGRIPQIVLGLLGIGAFALALSSSVRLFAMCVGTSAAALAFLNSAESIGRDERVALADLVLLTPLIFLFCRGGL